MRKAVRIWRWSCRFSPTLGASRRQDHRPVGVSRAAVDAQIDARRPPGLNSDALGLGAGEDPQVPAMPGRPDEGAHGVEAEAGFLGYLEIGGAEIVAVVEIIALRHAEFLGRFADRIEDRPGQALLLDAQFAVLAVEGTAQRVVVLRAAKQRQDVVPTPADIAELAPAVIVGGLATHIDHAVDGGAAAHHPASRIGELASVEAHFGLGGITPVRARIAHAVEIADRDMDPVITIGAAGFDKQHGVLRVGAQAIGENAARRAGADDDVAVSAEMSAFVGGCSLHRRPFRRGGAISSVSSERDIRAKPMPSTLRHSRPPCRESSLGTA